ncbi:MFS transporter [Variovorax ureilyticus]|uniref:MFS transporter n=1 Tax=Variovorax ureilyticus TaxID=1836198 RepID=A0ABU8VHD4_9BURK
MPSRLQILVLSLAGFASMASMRLCDAMLPALGASFGVEAAAASGAVSAFAIAYGVLQIVYGPLGDRFGKPLVAGVAAILCGMGAVGAAMSTTLPMLVLSRAAMGAAAGGIIPLTMAWLADRVPPGERQVVLARLLTFTVTGMMAGSWAGGIAAETIGWRSAFAIMASGFVAIGALVFAAAHARPVPSHAQLSLLARFSSVLSIAWARHLLSVTFAEGALVFGALAFLPVLLHQRFELPLSTAGGILAMFGVGGIVYSRSARWLLHRLPPPRLAIGGGVLLCASFLVIATMNHWAWALVASLTAGCGFYMLHNTLQACGASLSSTARGTAVSLFACALFMGQSAGVTAAAWLTAHGWTSWWYAVAGPALLALALVFAAALPIAKEPR